MNTGRTVPRRLACAGSPVHEPVGAVISVIAVPGGNESIDSPVKAPLTGLAAGTARYQSPVSPTRAAPGQLQRALARLPRATSETDPSVTRRSARREASATSF